MKLDREKFLAAAFVMVGASSALAGCSKKEPTADTQAVTPPAAETTAVKPPAPPPAPNAEAVVKPGDRVVRVPAPNAEAAAPATPPAGAPPKIRPVTK